MAVSTMLFKFGTWLNRLRNKACWSEVKVAATRAIADHPVSEKEQCQMATGKHDKDRCEMALMLLMRRLQLRVNPQ